MTPIDTPVAADAAVTLSSATVAPEADTVTVEATLEVTPVQSSAYRDRLNPWCVVRLSEQAPVPVARFRRRPDAEAHLRLLGPANQNKFAIVFHKAETAAE